MTRRAFEATAGSKDFGECTAAGRRNRKREARPGEYYHARRRRREISRPSTRGWR